MRAIGAPADPAAASGFSSTSSSRAATARTAASMRAIWAGNKSRNRPEMRQVTSTRDLPMLAVGNLLAAGAQGGAAPKIDDRRARHFAMRLRVGADHLVGGKAAEIARRRRRQHARIGDEHVTSGRQDVAATAPWRAGGAGRDAATVQRGEDRNAFRLRARAPSRIPDIRGRAHIDMKSVLDAEILEIAEPSVDAP